MNASITSNAAPGKRCSRCAACDDGTHPAPAEQRQIPSPSSIHHAAPAVQPLDEKMSMKNQKSVITPAILKAIREAKPSESSMALAKRLGVESHIVYYHRPKLLKEEKTPEAAKTRALSHPENEAQNCDLPRSRWMSCIALLRHEALIEIKARKGAAR